MVNIDFEDDGRKTKRQTEAPRIYVSQIFLSVSLDKPLILVQRRARNPVALVAPI
jgi:hypothetical protein